MYEHYFRAFVAFLLPNKFFPDDSILLLIEGGMSIADFEEYQRIHNVVLEEDAVDVVMALRDLLMEMRKTKDDPPKKDLIDYHLERAMSYLAFQDIEKARTFREFLSEQKNAKKKKNA